MSDQPDVPDIEVNLPAPDGLRVTTELPYNILVAGDFAGGGTLQGPLVEGVVRLASDGFDDLLADAKPHQSFTIKDLAKPGGQMVTVDLVFDSLKSFSPLQLVERIPQTALLVKAREAVVSRLHGKMTAEQLAEVLAADADLAFVAQAVEAVPPPAPKTDPAAVDAVLDQLDFGDDEQPADSPPAQTPIGSLVSAAAGGGGIPAGEVAALRKAITEVDHRMSAWVTAVLHHPNVQRLESAWRGLSWLMSKVDYRKGIRLSVLHATTDALVDRFVSCVIDPVFDEGAEAPSAVVIDAAFGNAASDMQTLDGMAQQAMSLPATVLAGLSPAFFGVKHAWQIPTLPPIGNMFDQWQFAKWKSLRRAMYATAMGVVFGRLLLRGPYGRDDVEDLAFDYKEPCIGDKDFVWASGGMAGAATLAASVSEIGWPCRMAGQAFGRIEGLPRAAAGKSGDKWFGPADTKTPQPRVEEMGMAGINAVVSAGEGDDAVFCNGLTCAYAARADANALLEISLPYQLFAGRLSALMWELKSHLVGKSAEQIVASVRAHVRDWLALANEPTEEEVSVQVRPKEDDPDTLELALVVTPPASILPGEVPVVLGYAL